jgi:hypothetical protein
LHWLESALLVPLYHHVHLQHSAPLVPLYHHVHLQQSALLVPLYHHVHLQHSAPLVPLYHHVHCLQSAPLVSFIQIRPLQIAVARFSITNTFLPQNADNIIFATCIVHNYLRDQGVDLSDMWSSANVRSNLTKIPNQKRSAHQSAFEVRENFEQFFNSPSGSVLW